MVEIEPKGPSPIETVSKETIHIEVVGMTIIECAELLMPGSLTDNAKILILEGRTIDELAQKAKPNVFGIRTFKRVEGTVMVGGNPIQVSSRNFDYSGTVFIDGQVMDLDEVLKLEPSKKRLVAYVRENGGQKMIKTRTGDLEPFLEGDRNIILPKKGEEE